MKEVGNYKYDPAIAYEFCATIATTPKSMKTICQEMGLEIRTVWRWIGSIDDFREMYDKAKEQQAEYLAEEMLEIADQPSKDLIDAMDRKLRVNTRQWAASKLKPKKYGQHTTTDITFDFKRPMTPEQFQQFLDQQEKKAIGQQTEEIGYEDVTNHDNDEDTEHEGDTATE